MRVPWPANGIQKSGSRSGPFGGGKKSIAFRLRLRSRVTCRLLRTGRPFFVSGDFPSVI